MCQFCNIQQLQASNPQEHPSDSSESDSSEVKEESSGEETEEYNYQPESDSDLDAFFNDKEAFLQIPTALEMEDFDPDLSDFEYLSD